MKLKYTHVSLCALLALITYFSLLTGERRRRALQETQSRYVLAKDGTLIDLSNHFSVVVTTPKSATNAPPARH
jgi:hypothetical protein